jgi:hypothetical protein
MLGGTHIDEYKARQRTTKNIAKHKTIFKKKVPVK